jgi:hypothetical protein
MEQLPHNLEYRGTTPLVHVRAHHQSAATRFRAKVRKSQKAESRKIERKKLKSLRCERSMQGDNTERANLMMQKWIINQM